jgi:hypothetical protein
MLFLLHICGVSADSPIPGSTSIFLLGHPKFVITANSAAGGPLFSEGSYALNMNPALTAGLQFPAMDLGYTGLQQLEGISSGHGSTFHLGGSFPTRWGVLSGSAYGIFVNLGEMNLGDAGLFRLGFSRDVTENLYLGLLVGYGYLAVESLSDYHVAADLGAWYRIKQLAFLKNLRFAVVLQNLGKPFNFPSVMNFPPMLTPKVGVAASLLELNKFSIGVSADIMFPSFIDFALNTGVQIMIANFVTISGGWDFDAREATLPGATLHLPYVALGVRFKVDTSGINRMSRRGYTNMMLDLDAVWQRRQGSVNLVSAGAAAVFGVRDITPPAINIGEIRYQR